jgi:pentose-5-phosphate-3-epimerase
MSWQDWIRTVEIAPVLVPGPADTLATQVDALVRTGARVFHLHVSRDLAELETARLVSPLLRRYEGILEVEIDVRPDPGVCSAVAAAGGSSVTFPLGAVADPGSALACARDAGLQVGIALDASTDLLEASRLASGADLVRCPGRRLQDQLPDLDLLSRSLAPGIAIEVGGGVTYETAGALFEAGARVLLVRAAIFGYEDLPRSYRRLVQAMA